MQETEIHIYQLNRTTEYEKNSICKVLRMKQVQNLAKEVALKSSSCLYILLYLDISVEADSRVNDAFQFLKCHWTLLLIVDEEDQDPACEVQQDSYCCPFTDAPVRPARSNRENIGQS